MKSVYFQLLWFFCLLITKSSPAQIPSGTWRDHLPYTNALQVAEVGNKIYCSTDGGLFSINKGDNSLQKYSKVSGLSDVEISSINYSENTNTIIIAYVNGNIDLIRNDSIINIPDIKMKLITGDKQIYSILFIDNIAYLATGFGIVALDINRKEIKDTYQFGEAGSQITVNDLTSDGEYIFAATNQGIYRASINSPNLVDYNYWSRITNVPIADYKYSFITYFSDMLFACYKNPATEYDNIILIREDSWENWGGVSEHYYYLGSHNNKLIIVDLYKANAYDTQFNRTQYVQHPSTYLAKHAMVDKDNILWVATLNDGLLKSESGNIEIIAPNGPAYKDVGSLTYESGHLWVGGGNEATQWDYKGAYAFIDEKWENYNKKSITELEGFPNISEVAIDPSNPDHVYGGSYGYGIVEFNGGEVQEIFDEEDGILQPIEGYGHGFIRVMGMDYDENRDLWITLNLVENPVYVIRSDGEWENLNFTSDIFGINTRITGLLVTSFNQVWLLLDRDGIFAFRENSNGTISEKFFTIKNQDGELIERVYSAVEDLDGNIWVGTNKGPVVYYNPSNIFEEQVITGFQIQIPRNDGTNLADLLLENEVINTIAVDGANRKWFGTETSGVFLMSEDGKEEIHSFNEDNSPLFSNKVASIAINQDNGEIFFGTDKGVLSFMGQAVAGNEDFNNVYVYPNPVRENYEGDITITGLVTNANVKITDISGNIVFETTALGGQAIWDGRNFTGNRVHTGVYLVFCTNEDGSKTYVTKLLFIH
ncbi:MAG: T9SS type A sorting domain-containing protein [Bacteroidales bacterium]|nr:MAG: T9SS type A sorting domain-containing protein [Bacteroidales bacterium]